MLLYAPIAMRSSKYAESNEIPTMDLHTLKRDLQSLKRDQWTLKKDIYAINRNPQTASTHYYRDLEECRSKQTYIHTKETKREETLLKRDLYTLKRDLYTLE